ncbi:MAG: phosphatidylglycerol lysyltransferase domain-containing protein [Candidatus Omnitrophica bacterium]|nr:phosphatidylglycerol lysyltransferase domain-containing protein [Candidatus Omnitrophota bacterium]MDD5351664.1 phosphatidylglycerol lysyltransferase domain-containing protein [Candidatus Omnitrophota bacterium]MDD5550874.1 phosphatidylglycerol lysyltransferase domain-containing protein [Candidatus Omnitrophota bacterium]
MMQFERLSLNDKLIFERFLSQRKHSLSAYAFTNIFIWRSIYDIFWAKINKSLCVFFKDRVGCFLYLPPLAKELDLKAVNKCFKIMNGFNKNPVISRIENVETKDTGFYKNSGYEVVLGSYDYVCKKDSLVNLQGNSFKSKRCAVNYFVDNYSFKYRLYQEKDKKECLDLYSLWMKERKEKNKDRIYEKLLDDNFSVFKATLDYYNKLNFIGRIIKINNDIKAVTLGYRLNKNTFVVLFEVCDLNFKGIAQYIFREFCSELNYKDINIMDDSGLDNLKRVKLSYRPYKRAENFVVRNE